MSRLPIRVRLTLTFALAMAVVLVATGAFLYFRLASSLDEAIDEGLQAQLAQVQPAVRVGRSIRDTPLAEEERFVQVLTRDGRIVDATPQVATSPVLPSRWLERAATDETFSVESSDVPGFRGPTRLLVRRMATPAGERLVVVGASLEDRNDTVHGLLTELLLIGPAALLLASLLGYAVAAAALRPVESMRAEAAAISAAEPGRRLPLPPAADEVRRLGETLNAMLERLEAALARERAFVADASHELRTPLALLKAELDLALRRPRSSSELEAALGSAAAETDRLVRLAEDLLVLARSDQRRLSLRRERISASRLLSDVAGRFRQEAGKNGRTIDVAAAADLQLVGDRVRLDQALGNLVENALRHGSGVISLGAAETDGAFELHVADDGPGFPPEFLGRAFERFARADEARSGDGTGLGLAIVQAIARAHGGTVGASNRAEGGADVWLSIPHA
ncbi:MAG TPA: ATP-binding protein [Gaiellaceae bacterium]|jgi:heavy metal sensor kinase|nr:ATP-binding protein [Gaiellaceae bacterium]